MSAERIAELIKFHSQDCSKLVHGQCHTRRCLVRGGWTVGDPSYATAATCEAFETVEYLRAALSRSTGEEK
jgi:hypothetical protein